MWFYFNEKKKCIGNHSTLPSSSLTPIFVYVIKFFMILKVDWRMKTFLPLKTFVNNRFRNVSILTSLVQWCMGSTEIISEKSFWAWMCSVVWRAQKCILKKSFWARMCSVVWRAQKCILKKAFDLGSAVDSKNSVQHLCAPSIVLKYITKVFTELSDLGYAVLYGEHWKKLSSSEVQWIQK